MSRDSRESPTTDTSFTWKCSTAPAPALCPTQAERVLKAAAAKAVASPAGGEEGSVATLALDETFDTVRSGTRLILSYDATGNSFKGTVENTTDDILDRVRIEVHLSNGTELGPTTPTDMTPGEVAAINLPATQASFTGWTAHAEVGGGGDGNESGDEHGGDRKSGDEHGNGGERRSGG